MTSALILLLCLTYIALSLFFKFTPRLRVGAGLVAGGLLAGIVAKNLRKWLASAIEWVAPGLGDLVGQDTRAIEVALPTVVAFALAVVVAVFIRKSKGGAGKSSGKSGGGGGKAVLAHVALGCALLLPIVAGSLGELIRSVPR